MQQISLKLVSLAGLCQSSRLKTMLDRYPIHRLGRHLSVLYVVSATCARHSYVAPKNKKQKTFG